MKEYEARAILQTMVDRFDGWQPNPGEQNGWITMLSGLDEETARRTIQPCWEATQYKAPKPKTFRDCYNLLRSQQGHDPHQAKNTSGPVDSGIYLVCVARDENGRGPVGCRIPMVYPPGRCPAPAHVRRVAHEIEKPRKEEFIGGQWEVWEGWAFPQLVEECIRLSQENRRRSRRGQPTEHAPGVLSGLRNDERRKNGVTVG
ncbi:MAG: hypothetical protein ACOC8H_00070 [bacterium]